MRNKGYVSRVIAFLVTLAFMLLVRPDAEPSRAAATLVAILLYEGIRWSVEYIMTVNQQSEHRHNVELNLKARKEDGERLDEMLFNPIREVY